MNDYLAYDQVLDAARKYAAGFRRFDLPTATYAIAGQLNYSVPAGGGGWFRGRVRRAMEQQVSEGTLTVFPAGTELPEGGTSQYREYQATGTVATAREENAAVIPGKPGAAAHPSTLLVPPGSDEPVEIDTALVPLITALWEAGFETITCCQDIGESIASVNERHAAYWKGWVQVELPGKDACRLAELAAAHGFPMHWAHDDAWVMSAPVVMLGSRALLMNLVQVRFPVAQLTALVSVVGKYGRDFR